MTLLGKLPGKKGNGVEARERRLSFETWLPAGARGSVREVVKGKGKEGSVEGKKEVWRESSLCSCLGMESSGNR